MTKTATAGRRPTISLVKRQQRAGYVFVAPIIIGLILILIPVVVQTFAFSVWRPERQDAGITYTYVGISEYVKLLTQNAWYVQTLVSSVQQVLIDFFTILIFSFFIALLLTQNFRGKGLARVIFFLPVVVSAGIMNKLEVGDLLTTSMQQMTGADTGVINQMANMDLSSMLYSTSLPPVITDFVVSAVGGIYNMVMSSGVQILVFIAGLQSISPQLYEAARVEGCSAWESFWKITLPMISPLILVSGMYTFIDSCSKPSNVIMEQVLNQTTLGNYSTSAAMALVYFFIVAAIMGVIFLVIRKLVFYQE